MRSASPESPNGPLSRTLLAQSRCQRRYPPMLVGFIPECRSKTGAGTADEIVFAADNDTFRIIPGPSGYALVPRGGDGPEILLRRTNSPPKPCGQPLVDTPLTNYQVFWQTFTEQYAFFALRPENSTCARRELYSAAPYTRLLKRDFRSTLLVSWNAR
jgi:hypothetical protein